MNSIVELHRGKVRDSAILSDNTRIIYTTNRISAFDVVLPFEVPSKGETLQAISTWNFLNTKHIVANHFVGSLDSQNIVTKNVTVLPLEIVVRGSLSGSLWRLYEKGGAALVRETYGVEIEDGLSRDATLASPIVTPTTKASSGHDMPLSQREAEAHLKAFLQQKGLPLDAADVWQELVRVGISLFNYGNEAAHRAGLILLDTKYEFGLDGLHLVLVDEVHTPDSSRYRYLNNAHYELSKEYLREQILKLSQSNPHEAPLASLEWWKRHANIDELTRELSRRYLEICRKLVPVTTAELTSRTSVRWPIYRDSFTDLMQELKVPKRIVIAGNGAREFALFKFFQKQPQVETIFCSPGERDWGDKYANASVRKPSDIAQFAKDNRATLVIGGNELVIAQGLSNECRAKGLQVLAPSEKSARLESSKIFCKEVALAAGVPTASSEVTTLQKLEETARSWLLKHKSCVVKYDGLASGKGVFMVNSEDDLQEAMEEIEANLATWKAVAASIGDASAEPRFLIEEKLEGTELSAIALCSGEEFRFLPIARDYKRRNDNQQGPNTGGMGTVAPLPLDAAELAQVQLAFGQLLKEMANRGLPYFGFLFCGFMKDAEGRLRLLECNCRLGDPEAQVIIPGLSSDFLLEMLRVAKRLSFYEKRPSGEFFRHDGLRRVFVVAASPEYPLAEVPARRVLAQSKNEGDLFPYSVEQNGITRGGRVIGALGTGASFSQARNAAYQTVERIELANLDDSTKVKPHFRRDIGAELV